MEYLENLLVWLGEKTRRADQLMLGAVHELNRLRVIPQYQSISLTVPVQDGRDLKRIEVDIVICDLQVAKRTLSDCNNGLLVSSVENEDGHMSIVGKVDNELRVRIAINARASALEFEFLRAPGQ
jgi:hypothetical protein